MWEKVSDKCITALQEVVKRFPQHFKSIHLLGRYYLYKKDLVKAKKFIWGVDGSAKANMLALFGERKNNNFFNGIWRLPLSEIDRAGSFSTHMGKCVETLITLASKTGDQYILLEITFQVWALTNFYQPRSG